jgi:UDP:flavonoid glycosyltransferase YjiC (YdhE family)
MQVEQRVNLDNVGAKRAGLRIPAYRWTASNIQTAVRNVLEHRRYLENAGDFSEAFVEQMGRRAPQKRYGDSLPPNKARGTAPDRLQPPLRLPTAWA